LYKYKASAAVEDRDEGCAMLSNTPFVTTFGVDIGDGKTAVGATTDTGLTFASLHLKGGPGTEGAKRAQIARVLEFVGSEARCVIGGDMNDTNPDGSFGDLMSAAGFRRIAYAGASGMTSDFSKQLTLDHLYVRGIARVEPVPLLVPGTGETISPGSPWRPEALVGSDHIPVVFELYLE
jgi:endonuclease/exonuclease/phosphatase family metal-dependent hydrolase